ncbi:hypothetical protein TNCV_2794081 [Trichonephila clavipes]|nr:hypothetical protein TNCV_2794081 [Trichonephila clavipes]
MSAKAYCTYLSLSDLRRWGACADVQSDAKSPVPKQAWYSLIYLLKGWKAEANLPSPEFEPRIDGVKARYTTELWERDTIYHSQGFSRGSIVSTIETRKDQKAIVTVDEILMPPF